MHNKIKRLQNLDKILFKINKYYSITDLYPTNIKEEKEKFFSIKDYNPKFEYQKTKINFREVQRELSQLKYKKTIMDKILKEKANEISKIINMFEEIGTDKFAKEANKVYGKPNNELIKKANNIIKKQEKPQESLKQKISSEKAVLEFKRIFKQLNLNWNVIEEEIASNAVVIPSKRTFAIKKGAEFTKKEIKRFIVHEIYTHVLRTEFGLRQPYKIFSTGLANYEATEEGLALFKEKRAGVMNQEMLKEYALRVLAVKKATNSSFRKTFEYLKEYVDSEKAWALTVRVKRGMKDTISKGAFTKDYIYLKGFFEVNEFIKNQSGLHLLHYGKINTKQALDIPSIEGLKNPFIVLKTHFKKNIQELSILY